MIEEIKQKQEKKRGFFVDLIDLTQDLDREGTIVNIKSNHSVTGADAWLLMASIMIASLGLDLNSPAVIIGAMLISPLMSPILGIGLSLGIRDERTMISSLKNFAVAIGIAIVTSTLYFLLTPFGNVTSEILGRTQPTLLDVLVAFFGGLAGIISGSRKDKSNAIPGVAIATALMPPLCVTGFSLAKSIKFGLMTDKYDFGSMMTNSFYFFFLNATFIALATFLIVRYLNFPVVKRGGDTEMKKTSWTIALVGLLMIIPSGYILKGVLTGIQQEETIKNFVSKNFPDAISETTKSFQNDSFNVKIYLFDGVTNEQKSEYEHALKNKYGIQNAKLQFIQTDIPDFKEVEMSVRENIMKQLEANSKITDERDKKIMKLTFTLDSLQSNQLLESSIEKEARILFPEIESLHFYPIDTSKTDNLPMLVVKWNKKKSGQLFEHRLKSFVKVRAGLDTLELVRK